MGNAACCNDHVGGLPVTAAPLRVELPGDSAKPVEDLNLPPPDDLLETEGPGLSYKHGEPSLSIHFILPDGRRRVCVFCRRPLGFDFEKKVPMTVNLLKSGGIGYKQGVRPGWIVACIDGEDIACMTFEKAFRKLKRSCMRLRSEHDDFPTSPVRLAA
mmetsp:Transcript_70817/g.207518  ORF Transcript_70817/g.207518 Transcript_70817/m.207518 type:complete len:158 (+) Transcript_70817:68-541(+)